MRRVLDPAPLERFRGSRLEPRVTAISAHLGKPRRPAGPVGLVRPGQGCTFGAGSPLILGCGPRGLALVGSGMVLHTTGAQPPWPNDLPPRPTIGVP